MSEWVSLVREERRGSSIENERERENLYASIMYVWIAEKEEYSCKALVSHKVYVIKYTRIYIYIYINTSLIGHQ